MGNKPFPMKMTAEHYAVIEEAIHSVPESWITNHKAFIYAEGRSRDLDERLRWDLLFHAVATQWICDNLYPYLSDNNIDSALRKIMREEGEQE